MSPREERYYSLSDVAQEIADAIELEAIRSEMQRIEDYILDDYAADVEV